MGWWLLRLLVNIFQLRLTKKLKVNFFCFKELNINKPVFCVSLGTDHYKTYGRGGRSTKKIFAQGKIK